VVRPKVGDMVGTFAAGNVAHNPGMGRYGSSLESLLHSVRD